MPAKYSFNCPHCRKGVEISIALQGPEVPTIGLSPAERAEQWRESAPPEIRRFLDDLEFRGVLDAFRRTVNRLKASHRPGNPYKYLFTILSTLHERTVPPHVAHVLQRHLGGGWVGIWQGQGIVLLTCDGYLKAFLDSADLDIPAPSKLEGPSSDDWVRTRFGYVTSPYLFDEFRRSALGAWDSLSKRPA